MRKGWIASGGLACALVAGPAVGAAAAVDIVPHRATYQLQPAPNASGSGARVVDGLIIFEIADACDGHTMTDRRVMVLSRDDGREMTFDSIYSAWESEDGRNFDFNSKLLVDGREVDALRGKASLDRSGGAGTATYTVPEPRKIALPEGTYFPVHAGEHTLGRIAAGETSLNYTLFDGSDAEGPVLAADFVTDAPMVAEREAIEGDVGLLDARSWRVRTAFFDLDDESAPPAAEFDGQTHANGVISRFVLEVESYAMAGELIKIEALPDSDCRE